MGSESTMRTKVCGILRKLDAVAVENRVGPGMPDIAYIGGWIETKYTADFPKMADSPVTLTHGLLITQRVWIRRHYRKGGTVHVLVQISNEFFLLDGMWACDLLGEADRETLTQWAVLHCVGWPQLESELFNFLRP